MLRTILRRYRDSFAGLPREAWLLAVALLVNRCGTMVMPFMAIYLTGQLGMTEGEAGRLLAVYGMGAVCGSYCGGVAAAAWGEFRVQTVCLAASAPCYLLILACRSWGSLAAALFLLSFVSDAVRPANAAAIARVTTPVNRSRAYALQRLALNLGFSIGPALGGVLATVDFHLLFWVDAITSLLAAAWLGRAFGMRRLEATVVPDAAVLPIKPLQDRSYVIFLALMMLTTTVFFQLGSTYPLYLRDHYGLSKPQIGLMYAVNTVVIVAVEMVLIDVARKWPLMPTLAWGSFLACAGFGLLPWGSSGSFAVLAMLVLTAGEMLLFPLSAGFVANRAGPGSEGRYMAWYTSTGALAMVLAPVIGTTLYERDPRLVWGAAWVAGLIVAAGLAWLHRQLAAEAAVARERPGDLSIAEDAESYSPPPHRRLDAACYGDMTLTAADDAVAAQ